MIQQRPGSTKGQRTNQARALNAQPNEAIRQLRKIIGRTQKEFAAMIGASKDTVVSWETGRNKLSATFARRICLATGADGKALLLGVSVPIYDDPLTGPKVYTAEAFERYRRTEWGRSDEAGARHHLRQAIDTLELLFLAAAKPGAGKLRYRLPGVVDSFIRWCEQASEEFKLGPQIQEQLQLRKFKIGLTQPYRAWRKMQKAEPAALRAMGFKDDPRKPDEAQLRLELEVIPGWAPGRRMKAPRPAILEAVAGMAAGKSTAKQAKKQV